MTFDKALIQTPNLVPDKLTFLQIIYNSIIRNIYIKRNSNIRALYVICMYLVYSSIRLPKRKDKYLTR